MDKNKVKDNIITALGIIIFFCLTLYAVVAIGNAVPPYSEPETRYEMVKR